MASNSIDSSQSGLLDSIEGPSEKLLNMEKDIAYLQNEARRLKKIYKNEQYYQNALFVMEELERASPTWELITKKVKTIDANRRCNMLTGPFFTSQEFPWPSNDDEPMLSVVQFDLRIASKLRNLPFGDHLLQVFIAPDRSNWVVRTIPRGVVESSPITALPVIERESFSVASSEWVSDDGYFEEIIGLSEPMISSTSRVREIPSDLPDELRVFIDKMNEVSGNSFGPTRLFGTFDSIHYFPSERPESFMCIDDDENFCWGPDGSAQIFYEFAEDGPRFDLEWSS
jgi:hypothetical protein